MKENFFILPDLGENIEGGDVIQVFVKAGDNVSVDTMVCEVETDKATIEVPSSVAGTVDQVLIQAGDTVKIGQPLFSLAGAETSPASTQKSEPKQEKPAEQSSASPQSSPSTSQEISIKIPDLGGNPDDQATVLSIFVQVGDSVQKEDNLIQLETDKATVDVPSTEAGTVKEILLKEGDNVMLGNPILILTSKETSSAQTAVSPEEPKPVVAQTETAETKTASVITLPVPDLGGDQGATADVLQVFVQANSSLEKGQIIAEIETDKATVEIPAEKEGTIVKVHIQAGDKINQGLPLVDIQSSTAEVTSTTTAPSKSTSETPKPTPPSSQPAKQQPVATTSSSSKKTAAFVDLVSDKRLLVPASPYVRRFAREIGVQIEEVKGTGVGNRISVEDVKAHSKMLHQNRPQSNKVQGGGSAGIVQPKLPDFTTWGEIKIDPMNKIKQVTAQHMSNCWSHIPHVTQFDKADIDSLEKLRKKHKSTAESKGLKLTMTAILLKATALALLEFPRFNSSIDVEKNEVILKKYIHIGIAVDTPNGLIVPVIRNVDQKSILDLASDLGEISKKARDRKVSPSDLQGGTFTISNLGGIAGTGFTPIVNWPEVAILGVSKSSVEPIFINGDFQPRLMMPLSLSYDHRVIDGADAARFLHQLISYLEDPFLISLFS